MVNVQHRYLVQLYSRSVVINFPQAAVESFGIEIFELAGLAQAQGA